MNLMSLIFPSLVNNLIRKICLVRMNIGLASIAVPPTDPLEQYLLDHENDLHMCERNEKI